MVACQRLLEFVKLGLGGIGWLELQDSLQVCEDREEGTILRVGRAAKLQAGGSLRYDPLLDLLQQARFTNAGLAAEQHDLAIPSLRRCPALQH